MPLVPRVVFLAVITIFAAGSAQGQFTDRYDQIQQMLKEALLIENSNPLESARLREKAKEEFEGLRKSVDNVQDAYETEINVLDGAISDAEWGEKWSYLGAGAHTALAGEKSVDLYIKLQGLDKNPAIKVILESKEWIKSGIEAISHDNTRPLLNKSLSSIAKNTKKSKINLGSDIKADTLLYGSDAATNLVSDEGNVLETAKSTLDTLSTHLSSPESKSTARKLTAFSDAIDVYQEGKKASLALDQADEFSKKQNTYNDQKARSRIKSEKWNERSDQLSKTLNDHPALQDESLQSSDFDYVYKVLKSSKGKMNPDSELSDSLLSMMDRSHADLVQDALDYLQGEIKMASYKSQRMSRANDREEDNFSKQMDAIATLMDKRDHLQRLAKKIGPNGLLEGSGNEETHEDHSHCPKGEFQCPNGLSWEKCGHEEKYSCPPLWFKAEANKIKNQILINQD